MSLMNRATLTVQVNGATQPTRRRIALRVAADAHRHGPERNRAVRLVTPLGEAPPFDAAIRGGPLLLHAVGVIRPNFVGTEPVGRTRATCTKASAAMTMRWGMGVCRSDAGGAHSARVGLCE